MMFIVVCLFLGFVVLIILLRFGRVAENSDGHKKQILHSVTTDKNDLDRTEKCGRQWIRKQTCSITHNIALEQNLSPHFNPEDQRSVNKKVQDIDRSYYNIDGPRNQNNVENERSREETRNGSLLAQEREWMTDAAVNNRECTIETEVCPPTSATEDRLLKVLKVLNLTDKYPGRLSRNDMYQITCSLPDDLPNCQEELAGYFMRTIARYDYRARECLMLKREDNVSSKFRVEQKYSFKQNRNKTYEKSSELSPSPMDVVIAIFLCCDDLCRQDLVSHIWRCRLSIPLVIQEKAPPFLPSCFIWPLQNLVMKWEVQKNGNTFVKEGRLVKEFFSSIAFIRVGNIEFSKSALINSVMSVTEKTNSVFFHRDSPGSTKYRYLVDGLIDVSWYFPMPKSEGKFDNHFKDAIMFLNLHGDACQLQSHLPVLSKLANIITVLTKVEYLGHCIEVMQYCLDMGKTIFVILTDKQIQENDKAVIEHCVDNIRAMDNQIEFLDVVDKQRAEFVKETRFILMKLVEGKCVCLENTCLSDINVRVDINTNVFRTTKKNAHAMSTLLRKTPSKDRNDSFIPLQGDPWINWSAINKERERTTLNQKHRDLHIHVTERVNTMKWYREQQIVMLQRKENNVLDLFLNSVKISNESKLFLRWLKCELDDVSRETLGPLYETYQNIMHQFIIADDHGKGKLKQCLEDIRKQLVLCSFGLEHIMREVGQIHEALHGERCQQLPLKNNLPEVAAEMLVDGYPLELFDGSANAVPIQWVTDTLKHLDNILQKKHKNAVTIKVITTIGIHSSLKSIMLNALFGCQSLVSAGRCTRGAYCHLIKIEETYSKDLGIDYVLALDTEGFQALDHSTSGEVVSHDNELFTFVIGLGDLTILNVLGVKNNYLQDALPLSLHAFLRMEMTTKVRTKCIVVHQNVSNEDKEIFLKQGRLLEDTLDTIMKMACKAEKTNLRSFKDIIELDVTKDVYYLPALVDEELPMSPINTRYSDELSLLKRDLVKKLLSKPTNTLSLFITHVQMLWSAVKRNDFVFLFRNLIESEVRNKLEEYWCEAHWKLRQPIDNIMSTGYIRIQNTDNINELNNIVKTIHFKVQEAIANERIRHREELDAYISKAGSLFSETMIKLSCNMDKRFNDLSSELRREIKVKLRELKRDQRRTFSVIDSKMTCKDTIRSNIEQLVRSVKMSNFGTKTDAEKLSLFEGQWISWKSKILEEAANYSALMYIEDDAFDALSRAFPSGRDALKKWIQAKSLSKYSFDDFKWEVMLTKVQCWTAKIGLSPKKEIKEIAKSLFRAVKVTLESRVGFLRAYSQQDIEQVVQDIKNHFQENRKVIKLKPSQEIYLAMIVCGYAIKRLQKIHQKCEIQNSLGNLLEKEKMHYLKIFTSLCNNDETINPLVVHCCEILRQGILQKLTHSLPDKIEIDLRRTSFIPATKAMVIYDLMINLARDASYEKFDLFIRNPLLSITHYIGTRIDNYIEQKGQTLQEEFVITLNAIEDGLWQALEKSVETDRSDFKIWLKTFRSETKGFIVLEDIYILHEYGDISTFDQRIFFERLSCCLKTVLEEIKSEMCSYLLQSHELFKSEVMKSMLKYILGCTTSCPFCGAICMMAQNGHNGVHYTTLHRPQGCNGGYYEGSKVLVTRTCSECVSSSELQFVYDKNGVDKSCYFEDYKTVYPEWTIMADTIEDETSFWKFFFAEYAKQIATESLKVPLIPLSWKELDCKTEIKKLEEKIKKGLSLRSAVQV